MHIVPVEWVVALLIRTRSMYKHSCVTVTNSVFSRAGVTGTGGFRLSQCGFSKQASRLSVRSGCRDAIMNAKICRWIVHPLRIPEGNENILFNSIMFQNMPLRMNKFYGIVFYTYLIDIIEDIFNEATTQEISRLVHGQHVTEKAC